MIVRMVRWLLGYVRFTVRGGSEERFLNQCARRGVYLWEITAGENAGACVSAGAYRYLRPCARRAGCRLCLRDKKGLPFFTVRFRRRPGLWAGAAVFLLVIHVLSLYVWTVRITGNSDVPTAEVESELAANGLYAGARKSGVDPHALQEKLMLQFPKIGWASVNTLGCVTEVRIQEKKDRPEIIERDRVCNIKAAATGQILSLKVYAGTPLVREGDAVAEGQLLVSAVVEDAYGGTSLKHAAADILAETTRTFTVRVPMEKREWLPAGKVVVRRSLNLFGARIPLTLIGKPKGEYRAEAVRTGVSLFGTPLPLELCEETWTQVRGSDTKRTRPQALAEGKRQLEDSVRADLSAAGAEKISSTIRDTVEKGDLVCTAIVKCRENIAKESEILIK